MPRANTVSEKIWAQAIHAVTVQKMSLRRAAQLYGVHHMSLHRRVRGRYMTNQASRFEGSFTLTAAEEDEVVSVLREQFMHEHHVSADDVRFVVRTIASHDGRREIPSDFPLNRWIANFKRIHGFLAAAAGPKLPESVVAAASPAATVAQLGLDHLTYPPPSRYASSGPYTALYMYDEEMPSVERQQQQQRKEQQQRQHDDNDGAIEGRRYYQRQPQRANPQVSDGAPDNESSSGSDSERRDPRDGRTSPSTPSTEAAGGSDDKRCRQSTSVSAETWDKAMDAVEVHGMSLRTAAKAYGVHFAALHRRLKKRAVQKAQPPPMENYLPFEDEAGIVRVIHARADLGILMTFDELVDLLERTAMKYRPLTVESSQAMVRRFQSRVEQSIRHLIKDWPLQRVDVPTSFCYATTSGEDKGLPAPPKAPSITSPPPLSLGGLIKSPGLPPLPPPPQHPHLPSLFPLAPSAPKSSFVAATSDLMPLLRPLYAAATAVTEAATSPLIERETSPRSLARLLRRY